MTGNDLPPDVQVVNQFMLPRTGTDANEQEEQEMTEKEVSEQ